MSETQVILNYHTLLHSIAWRLTGCANAAEDIVQDTYLKWLTIGPEKVRNTRAYLVTSVRNNCIRYMESLQQKKSEWLEQLPAGWTDKLQVSSHNIFAEEEVKHALAVIHHHLEPVEKGIFILRGIFQLEYEELQEIFEKKKEHCRQLFSRARKKIRSTQARPMISEESDQLWSKVESAYLKGSLSDLITHLKKES